MAVGAPSPGTDSGGATAALFTSTGLAKGFDPRAEAVRDASGALIAPRRPKAPGERVPARRAFVVVGLGFGDEGKGSVVDALVRRTGASLVVRHNGGAQAAHNVVTPDGREHCFQMFGAGTLAGARTYLSEYTLVNPFVLAVEGARLAELDEGIASQGALSLVSVNADAPLTTPFHVALNRIRELVAGAGRHGSCGMGIGETMRDVLAGQGLRFGAVGEVGFHRSLKDLQGMKLAQALGLIEGRTVDEAAKGRIDQELHVLSSRDALTDTLAAFEMVAQAVDVVGDLPEAQTYVFEGAQGVLLDEHWGYHPHKTFSTTTSRNALRVLHGKPVEVSVLGLLRAYSTRHGHGPLPTVIGAGEQDELREGMLRGEHNAKNHWQERFRVGHPDTEAARYAARADGNIDGLVVTCTDRIEGHPMRLAKGYRDVRLTGLPEGAEEGLARTEGLFHANVVYEEVSAESVPERLAESVGVPLVGLSHGPRAEGKEWALAVGGRAKRTPLHP
jgi:adenylosuccinate synthase